MEVCINWQTRIVQSYCIYLRQKAVLKNKIRKIRGQKRKLNLMYPTSQDLLTGWEHRHKEQHPLPSPEMHTLDLLDQQTSSSNQSWKPQSFLWSPKCYQAYCQPDNRKEKKNPLQKKLWSCPKSKHFKTGSSSRICIVENKWKIVYPLYSVFFDAQSEVESSMTHLLKHFCRKVRLLQLRFSTLCTINII